MVQAEKALKPSWVSLKFSPDYLTASMEYSQAATKFRAASMLSESVEAWVKAAETKEKCHDVFGAGRAYESAGAICDGSGPGGSDAAAGHWQQAIRCFRLAGKGEIAAKLILKLAALREQQGDALATRSAFEDAIEVFSQDEKDYNLADVYKQYIGFLVRSAAYEEALKAIDGHIAVLVRQKHFPFVHKELLAKVVLLLHLQDTVRADEALRPAGEAEGWFSSKEGQVGFDLVAAFQANDAEAVERLVKDQVLTFLQVEIARLGRQLRVHGSQPAAVPGGGGSGKEAAPTKPKDLADMLM